MKLPVPQLHRSIKLIPREDNKTKQNTRKYPIPNPITCPQGYRGQRLRAKFSLTKKISHPSASGAKVKQSPPTTPPKPTMLPTPDTSHVPYSRVYEPAEDSFLLLDTLSSPSESAFLTTRFATGPSPLIVELGPGSGVVLAFLTAHSLPILGTRTPLALGIDVNRFACAATAATVSKAVTASPGTSASFLDVVQGDLASPLRTAMVDVLVFNPPYVPTEELPAPPGPASAGVVGGKTTYEEDSHLLALSYAGGRDGMEATERVLAGLPGTLARRGVAYVLLCAGNRPEEVKARMRGEGWMAETVGTSGRTAGWEKLQVVRIWREE